jgi:hypothetical protein
MTTIRKLNLNTILLILGTLALFAPDLASVAAWLAGAGVTWLATVAKVFGAAALLLSSLPRIIGRLRPVLALLGLATQPADSLDALPIPAGETTSTGATPVVPVMVQAAPLPSSTPTPVTVPLHPKDRGSAQVRALFVAALLGLLAALVAPLLCPRTARAEGPQLGTCLDAANSWCIQPATALGWQINLKTGDVRNAAVLVGYSLVHQRGFAFGAGVYGGVGLASDGPNAPQLHILASLTNFGAVGCGVQRATFASGTVAWQGVCGLYGALNFGGSPRYVAGVAGR